MKRHTAHLLGKSEEALSREGFKHLVGIPPAGIVLLSREGFKHLVGIPPAGTVLLSREGFKHLYNYI